MVSVVDSAALQYGYKAIKACVHSGGNLQGSRPSHLTANCTSGFYLLIPHVLGPISAVCLRHCDEERASNGDC